MLRPDLLQSECGSSGIYDLRTESLSPNPFRENVGKPHSEHCHFGLGYQPTLSTTSVACLVIAGWRFKFLNWQRAKFRDRYRHGKIELVNSPLVIKLARAPFLFEESLTAGGGVSPCGGGRRPRGHHGEGGPGRRHRGDRGRRRRGHHGGGACGAAKHSGYHSGSAAGIFPTEPFSRERTKIETKGAMRWV